MYKRVLIICEGETEQEFCTKILRPFFATKELFIQAPLIKKSMGGIVKWSELKKQITTHLVVESDVYVTILIDYYGLYSKYQFPGWDESLSIPDKNQRMDFLETEMAKDIDDSFRYRFVPYFQLHEFEGLLFNELEIFHEQIPSNELVGLQELQKTFSSYSNPEMINNNRYTSPSHRLKRIILGYNKIVYGNILAEAIGLDRMRTKSPRFNGWLQKIESLAKTQPT